MANLPTTNNNPGDLRYAGQDTASQGQGGFASFPTAQQGYGALLNDLQAKINSHPEHTLADFANQYAPSSDGNNSAQYAANLANQLKVSPNATIGSLSSNLGAFAEAVAKNEGYQSAPPQTAQPQPNDPASLDQASAQKYGAPFAADTTNDTPLSAAGKVLGNFIPSAFNFAKGVVNTLNPVNIVSNVAKGVQGFGDAATNFGGGNMVAGILPAAASLAKNIIAPGASDASGNEQRSVGNLGGFTQGALFKGVLPEAAQGVVKGGLGAITGNEAQKNAGLQTAQRSIENDPVGQILPLLLAGEGGAKAADTVTSKSAMADYVDNIKTNTDTGKPIPEPSTTYSDALDKGVSTIASPITKTASTVFGKAADFTGKVAGGGAAKLTGLNPETMSTIADNPDAFSKQNRANTNRISLGQDIQSSLNKRVSELSDTGKEYAPIREATQPVKVDPKFLEDSITKETGVSFKKGSIETSGAAKIRDAGDVRALQHLYDLWKPVFKKGELTPNEFLNFRKDLADLSKFDRQIGKSEPVETAAKGIRKTFNTQYRPQVAGLDKLDESFSSQTSDLKGLSKGLVDRDGNITDSGMAKIANLSKDKPNLAAQLEKISPGIGKKVQILKAVKDIENASGSGKVGTYTSTVAGVGGLGAGLATGNIPLIAGAIAEMILTNPESATAIIRKYGATKPIIDAVITKLKSGAGGINNLPTKLVGAFSPRQN